MVVQTYAPVNRVDVDKLYVDDTTPASWLELEVRVVELLENRILAQEQSRAIVYALRILAERGEAVPADSGDLYLLMKPVLERMPGGYG